MSTNTAKIERVYAPQSLSLSVDLMLDKESGAFYAHVAGKCVSADSKAKAIALVKAALGKLTTVEWREVIVLRVNTSHTNDEEDESNDGYSENGNRVLSASCSFTYMRRERATNPTKKRETIERSHRQDFEEEIAEMRKRILEWEGPRVRQEKADAAEKDARDRRAALTKVDAQWPIRSGIKEYELPYSPEAWAGIRRIARALLDTQARLDEFARSATPERLVQLGTGDALRLLPAAPKKAQAS